MAFGQGPLSNPLLVDAMEQSFVPLAIHNNLAGEDERILQRYGEPASNNPVVRFFVPVGGELLPRQANVYGADEVAARMIAALEKGGFAVPGYLELAREELGVDPLERVILEMYCFWKGEAVLGEMRGVRATRAAWMNEREVVEVTFDPRVVAFERIVARAAELECADRVFATTPEQLELARELVGSRAAFTEEYPRLAKAADRKYYLERSPVRILPLSPLQEVRLNAALSKGRALASLAPDLLTPRQGALLERIAKRFEEDAEAFQGLQRPEVFSEWGAYVDRLEERLTPSGTR